MNLRWLLAIAVLGAGAETGWAQAASCPADRRIVEFSGLGDQGERDRQRACLVSTLSIPNTIVHLGPDVAFNFSGMNDFTFPIELGRCVTVKGVAAVSGSVPCPQPPPSIGAVTRRENTAALRSREGNRRPARPVPSEPAPARTS